ncbi:hypothetical protein POM88_014440 [Heracleum sosnowskyi]|uniref:Uncharacterized protein n=1 Tax=Heracleum sosnowskyi TaxID=360622 RepID=A0AAD8J1Y4_9APIA|nr:hypothetical protein POM88_014440 [Heracleum sosnowskyi]
MKKKSKETPRSSSLIPTPTDLKTLINDHSLFFDKLVQLIPAQYYLSTDDDNKPWYQGLSKAAKASAKHQTRENIKKARRARLDPENSQKTTLDILKKKIQTEEKVQALSSSSSVTYEELQQRLQAKLVELRSNRGQGKRSVIDRKRKRDDYFDDVEAVGDGSQLVREGGNVDIDKEVEAAAEGIEFGKLRIDNEVGGRDKKRNKGSKAVELERARKLEEAKKDPEKGEVVAKQHSWKAATSRAMGIKVHDSTKILKESIKKDKKRHEKNASKWKERVESKDKLSKEKQQKRAGNIAERAKQKKDRKIAKREKKLMRPGFEGRKQGYINGDKFCNIFFPFFVIELTIILRQYLLRSTNVVFTVKGRTVVIEQSYGAPKVTKDGVTVAKSIEFKDKVKNIGASLVKQITISKDDTVVLDGAGEKKSIEERCEQIRSSIELSTSDYYKEKFQERLAKLSGGVAVLKIGGASETEVRIVPGGGVALLYAAKELEKLPTANFDHKIGVQIIQNALKMPVHTIATNAGVEGAVVVGKLLEQDDLDLGYDAAKGAYVDMVKAGIIDPLKVIRTALVDAASVSSLMTTTEAIVVELPKDDKDVPMGGGMGGMGGMDY